MKQTAPPDSCWIWAEGIPTTIVPPKDMGELWDDSTGSPTKDKPLYLVEQIAQSVEVKSECPFPAVQPLVISSLPASREYKAVGN